MNNTVFSCTPRIFTKTALALALSAALWTSTVPAEPWHEVQEQPLLDAFFQHYNYCDAMTLAMLWSGSEEGAAVYDAKLQGGYKVANFGSADVWDYHLQPKLASFDNSRTVPQGLGWADCYYVNSGFGYEHAEAVACLWQQHEGSQISIEDAKLWIGLGVGLRHDNEIAGIIDQAAQAGCQLG